MSHVYHSLSDTCYIHINTSYNNILLLKIVVNCSQYTISVLYNTVVSFDMHSETITIIHICICLSFFCSKIHGKLDTLMNGRRAVFK